MVGGGALTRIDWEGGGGGGGGEGVGGSWSLTSGVLTIWCRILINTAEGSFGV